MIFTPSRFRVNSPAPSVADMAPATAFNAAVASVASLADLAAVADSVSLSLNKSLGAPFGAMLAGSAEFIDKALRVRHRLGGGFRPTAMVSAAALAALRSFAHIAEDHRRARQLAQRLGVLPGLAVDLTAVETNIVFVSTGTDRAGATIVQQLGEHGVKVMQFADDRIRLVTHRGIDDDAVERTVAVFESITVR